MALKFDIDSSRQQTLGLITDRDETGSLRRRAGPLLIFNDQPGGQNGGVSPMVSESLEREQRTRHSASRSDSTERTVYGQPPIDTESLRPDARSDLHRFESRK